MVALDESSPALQPCHCVADEATVLRVFRVGVVVVALPSPFHVFHLELTVLEALGSQEFQTDDELCAE